jgi:hypothetical protein
MAVHCGRAQIAHALLALSALASPGCGSASPTAPTGALLTGEWKAITRIVDISSADCIGALYQNAVGRQINQAVQAIQTGTAVTIQNIALPSPTPSYNWSCQFAGTANESILDISNGRCEGGGFAAAVSNLLCADGSLRDVSFLDTHLSGSINGNLVTATEVDRYGIYPGGAFERPLPPTGVAPVGFMTVTSSFVMSR